MEHTYNDVHLRALYVLADLGGDHSIGWDGRTPQDDQQESTVPVAALLSAALSCFSLQEQLLDGNFSQENLYAMRFQF